MPPIDHMMGDKDSEDESMESIMAEIDNFEAAILKD